MMKRTFLDHLSTNETAFTVPLLAEIPLHALKALCMHFPFDMASNFGFESRLGKPEAFCDFFMLIYRDSPGAQIMAGKSHITDLSEHLRTDPLWQRISRLFEAWTTPGHPLYATVKEFWLEFDYHETSYNLSPNLFFGIAEDKEANKEIQWETTQHVLDQIYQILFDIPFPETLARNMQKYILKLPENTRLYQTGFMIPRQTEAIRLVLSKMTTDELIQYLVDIKWPGDLNEVKQMIEQYYTPFDYFLTQINVGKEIHPYLGVEMYFDKASQPQFNPKWATAFDLLEKDALLSQDKREALLHFCGKTKMNYLYPVKYIRGLNHIKLIYKQHYPIECKGYFGTIIQKEI